MPITHRFDDSNLADNHSRPELMTNGMMVHRQFIRYAVVGFASNLVGYLLYLFATWLDIGPKTAMTWLYLLGVLQTFFFNKRWTFRHQGTHGSVFFRYCMTYGLGYFFNLLVLLVLVDQQGYPHEIVQAIMIISLALMIFILQKYWVFQPHNSHPTPKA